MLFEVGQEVERVDRFELIEIGFPKTVKSGTIGRPEENVLGTPAVRTGAGGWRKSLTEFMLALFVLAKHFPSAFDDATRQPREARNLDAIAFVGAAGFDTAQKNDFAGRFFYRDVYVLYVG